MRDRQPNGNIGQREVIEATCSSAQVPTVAVVVNSITPDPIASINPTYFPAPSPSIVNIPQQPATGKFCGNVFFSSSQRFTSFFLSWNGFQCISLRLSTMRSIESMVCQSSNNSL